MNATKEQAERVVADLHERAAAQPDTKIGRRAAQNLYSAAATVAMIYGIGS